ncbi:hypothetical protein Nepgr_024770 [Nepenthes gracilis]|uniref:Uncharacterized protein n=1 Tax=Nepenthes gracilis TaxID=150966 RepID=A0AAD3T552_NEPGR|nr:hypothetical protein Nepgr_024770 [Nepenthes gracilis]
MQRIFSSDSVEVSGFTGVHNGSVVLSEAGPSLVVPMVASEPCVDAVCAELPKFQVGPPLSLAGCPPGRPIHSPDLTLGSGTDAPLLHPLAEIEYCPSKTLRSEHQHLRGQSVASFDDGPRPSNGPGASPQKASWAAVVEKRAFGGADAVGGILACDT